MTQPIDVAYVDIVARTKDLRREIKDIAEDDVKKLEKSFDDATKAIDKDFAETSRVADKTFTQIKDEGRDATRHLGNSFDDVFREIDNHFSRSKAHVHNFFDTIEEDARNAERRLRNRFFIPVENALRRLGGIVSDVGRGIGQLFGGIGGLAAGHPFAALIIAIIPPIIALVAALKDLFGIVALLPAGIAVLAATIIPAVVAFQNFGGAVSALASGDVDKINEAMKKLAPSARQVAVELANLIPILKDIQLQVQQGFFQPLIGQFAALAAVLANPLKNGLTTVASALGNFAAQLLKFFGSAQSVDMINRVFASTARIINALAEPTVKFLEAMSNSVVAALPFVERLGAAFGRFLEKFANFINEGIASGDFDKFIEDAFTITKELLQLGKSLSGFLGTLFAGTEESGHDLIQLLTDLFNRLNDFLKTSEGQDALRELVLLVKAFGLILDTAIDILISAQQQFSGFLKILESIGRGFTRLIVNIGKFFTDAWDKVTTFARRIPEAIRTAFINVFDAIFTGIGVAVGIGLFVITELPNKIANILLTLPQRIRDALSGAGTAFGETLQGWMDMGLEILKTGWNNIIEFIKSVPDRIKSLGSFFLNAGVNLIHAFMDGFRKVGTFIGDVAGDIVGAVKGFLNRAIDKINVGIAEVDKFLPGDLPRIPRLARGGIVGARDGGMLVNVAEGGEDEVISPLSKLKAMIAEVGGGVTFGPGAIVINLNGATPSLSEARGIGQQVGRGVLSIIDRTDVQATTKAMF